MGLSWFERLARHFDLDEETVLRTQSKHARGRQKPKGAKEKRRRRRKAARKMRKRNWYA